MITPVYAKFSIGVRIFTGLDIFHVGSVNPNRYVVLGFTGYSTSVTTNALSVVDSKTVVYHKNHQFKQ